MPITSGQNPTISRTTNGLSKVASLLDERSPEQSALIAVTTSVNYLIAVLSPRSHGEIEPAQ